MTTHDHDEHVVAWWSHERGHVGETELQQRVALDFRDTFMAFVDSYLDGETELLGERVGGPLGIIAATDIKVMRYAYGPSYDGVDYFAMSAEIARRQREERNQRAVAWLRNVTGRATSEAPVIAPDPDPSGPTLARLAYYVDNQAVIPGPVVLAWPN